MSKLTVGSPIIAGSFTSLEALELHNGISDSDMDLLALVDLALCMHVVGPTVAHPESLFALIRQSGY